jgi:acyl carrier protein
MKMEKIKSGLRELFVDTLRLPISPAEMGETNLIADLGIDSMATMELLTRVENQFHILIDDVDVSPALVDSLHTLADYISQKKSHAQPL